MIWSTTARGTSSTAAEKRMPQTPASAMVLRSASDICGPMMATPRALPPNCLSASSVTMLSASVAGNGVGVTTMLRLVPIRRCSIR